MPMIFVFLKEGRVDCICETAHSAEVQSFYYDEVATPIVLLSIMAPTLEDAWDAIDISLPPVERCIAPAQVYSYNWPEGDARHGVEGRMIDNDVYTDYLKYRAGDRTCVYAGSPGTGRIVYEITRIDETGVYAIEVANNTRELTIADVI